MILAPLLSALCAPVLAETHAPLEGRYVEARTASVFAGACHYNGELLADGREALLGWSITSGSVGGVDLAGLAVAALVVDQENLALSAVARRTIVYVPETATPSQREALVVWLEARHSDGLGRIEAVRTVRLSIDISAESYRLESAGNFLLSGDALPDSACCKMPFQVWYEPFEPLAGRLVGRDEEFWLVEPRFARTWSRPGENAAFFGAFTR